MAFGWHIENLEATDRLLRRFRNMIDPDATPLMVAWRLIITDDNRKGILAGLDRTGKPMAPVTYRPVAGKPINYRSKAAAHMRHGQRANKMRDLFFAGRGVHASGLNNNLTSGEYRRLTGPPLAPRGQFSRVISNLVTAHESFSAVSGTRVWRAFGAWAEVVSTKGQPFLQYHFLGSGHLPMRNLAGVRPDGRARARQAAIAWMKDVIRSSAP